MLVCGLFALAACATDGREMAAPPPGVTAPTTTTVDTGPSTTASLLNLTSPAFTEGGNIPAQYTCAGANVSPPLAWSGVPFGTLELAITVTDPDARNAVHWVVTGLPRELTSLAEAALPPEAVQSQASDGKVGWSGPCPPAGPAHRYTFTLYALQARSGLSDKDTASDAVKRLSQLSITQARLNASFGTG